MTNIIPEITMALPFNNRWYKSVPLFHPQTPCLKSSRKWGSFSIHVFFVFNDRINWFEYVLPTYMPPKAKVPKLELWTCYEHGVRHNETMVKTKFPSLLVLRNENFKVANFVTLAYLQGGCMLCTVQSAQSMARGTLWLPAVRHLKPPAWWDTRTFQITNMH